MTVTTTPGRRELDRPTIPVGPPVAEKRSRMPFVAIAAVIVLLLAAGVFMLGNKKVIPNEKPEIAPVVAHLGINAFPWATVESIRNLDNGQSIEIPSGTITPAPIDLAPGRYEVRLSNPNFTAPITRTVSITAGADQTLNVHFSDPSNATLPDFGGAR